MENADATANSQHHVCQNPRVSTVNCNKDANVEVTPRVKKSARRKGKAARDSSLHYYGKKRRREREKRAGQHEAKTPTRRIAAFTLSRGGGSEDVSRVSNQLRRSARQKKINPPSLRSSSLPVVSLRLIIVFLGLPATPRRSSHPPSSPRYISSVTTKVK